MNFQKETEVLENCEPVYEEVEGWKESTLGIKELDNLPANAKKVLKKIEEMLKNRSPDNLNRTEER